MGKKVIIGGLRDYMSCNTFMPPACTAELNLTHGTATAEAPAGKVVWGPGDRAAISGDPSKSTPPTAGEGLSPGC